MLNIDSSLITDLRGFAREARKLAYTGSPDKEYELLSLSNRLDAHAGRIERMATVVEGPGTRPGPHNLDQSFGGNGGVVAADGC